MQRVIERRGRDEPWRLSDCAGSHIHRTPLEAKCSSPPDILFAACGTSPSPVGLAAVDRPCGRHDMSTSITLKNPRRYFEEVGSKRFSIAERPPVCLYLEVTNRCNLLCETCPRTFETLEPPADMSWEMFTRIVDQFPNIARGVLHGV